MKTPSEEYLKIHRRGRPLIDLELFQDRSKGERPKYQGILVRQDAKLAVIQVPRLGVRRFYRIDGYEVASRERGGGLRILDLSQLEIKTDQKQSMGESNACVGIKAEQPSANVPEQTSTHRLATAYQRARETG